MLRSESPQNLHRQSRLHTGVGDTPSGLRHSSSMSDDSRFEDEPGRTTDDVAGGFMLTTFRHNGYEAVSTDQTRAPTPDDIVNDSQIPLTSAVHNEETENNTGLYTAPTTDLQTIKEWHSWALRHWFCGLMTLVHVGFIVALFVVDSLSTHNNGLVRLPASKSPSNLLEQLLVPRFEKYHSLLWITLPALIFSVYATVSVSIVAGTYERQPYVELYRGNSARRTIMLDYRTYPALYNYVVAFRHKHTLLGCAMLLGFIVTNVLSPLSSRLLVAASTIENSTRPISYNVTFDESFAIGAVNLQPFIDIAVAIHAYGSSPPRWMTTEYAFVPFYTPGGHASSTNLSAHTDAYSAYLDCNVIDSSDYVNTYSSQGMDNDADLGTATFNFVDRSCNVSQTFAVSGNTPTYSLSWRQSCQDQPTDRVGMLAATYSASAVGKLTARSVVSCIPSYWHSEGQLTVTQTEFPFLGSNYVSFALSKAAPISPTFSRAFEQALPAYSIFDPAAATNANAVGFAILSAANVAVSRGSAASVTPDLIRDMTEIVFTTIYAGLASSQLLVASENLTDGIAILSESIEKLFVSTYIAYTIAAILTLFLATHISLWIYAHQHHSILTEEPKGLISISILTEGDGIEGVLRQVRATSGSQVAGVRETLKHRFSTEVAECKWDGTRRQIVVKGLTEKPLQQNHLP